MRTAPKDGETIILVCTPKGDGTLAVVPAIWGQPNGWTEPNWWGSDFSLTTPGSNPFSDLAELRANLIAISPKCWKPWPKAKKP